MSKINIKINEKHNQIDINPDILLFWVLRDYLDLDGTKYGFGMLVYYQFY